MRSKKQKKNLYFFGASNIFRNQPKFIIVSTSKWISAHGLPWMAITFNILGLHCDRVHSIGPLINIYGMMCMRGIGCIKIDKYCAYTICILNWIDTWYMLWNFFFSGIKLPIAITKPFQSCVREKKNEPQNRFWKNIHFFVSRWFVKNDCNSASSILFFFFIIISFWCWLWFILNFGIFKFICIPFIIFLFRLGPHRWTTGNFIWIWRGFQSWCLWWVCGSNLYHCMLT